MVAVVFQNLQDVGWALKITKWWPEFTSAFQKGGGREPPLTLKNKKVNDKVVAVFFQILQNVGWISTTFSFTLLFFGVNGGKLT